jgi:predicted acyl esterase
VSLVEVLKRGHHIRLDISSSNFPRFDVNPNTGEPLNQQQRWRVAENPIYHDPPHTRPLFCCPLCRRTGQAGNLQQRMKRRNYDKS